ncbi:MAG: sulfatase-like hydrolase/transferase [Proteobacteria bacterium]|nr:sulfatase-like hydrolase/transferase [Pseudomonadota bacterium]
MNAPTTNAGDARPPLLGALSRAVYSATAAALVALLFDLYRARHALPSAAHVADFSMLAALRLWPLAMLVALAGTLLASLAHAAARRLKRSPTIISSLAFSLAAAPASLYIARHLFQGGFMSRLPFQAALIALSFALLSAGIALLAGLLIRGFGPAAPLRQHPIRFRLALLFLPALALLLYVCDACYYKRLYSYLHSALSFATLAALILFFYWLGMSRRPKRVANAAAVVLALLAVSLGAYHQVRPFAASQTVQVALLEETALTASVLRWESQLRTAQKHREISAAIQQAREQREWAVRQSQDQDFPAFPGAHLILISIDALRADRLGTLGNTARPLTPGIDAFAETATVFERAYCAAPHSSFSITSFHASRYTHVEGMLGRDITNPTMADLLRRQQYRDAAFYTAGIFYTEGDRIEHYRDAKFGFTNVVHGAPEADALTDYAIEQVERFKTAGEPPFFLWLHYFNVHEPYRATRFGTSPADRYDSEVALADAAVARFIRYADTHLSRDKVIVLTADHGEEFMEHGGHYHGSSLYDEQARVPLIIRVPGAAPQRIAHPVSLVDIAPTALKLLDVAPDPGMLGQDLRPAIFGGNEAHVARPVFASVMKQHMALMWPWKLIADPSRNVFMLFDLASDPAEKVNVYDRHTARGQDMLSEINAWLDDIARADDPAATVLNLGRMRSKHAVPQLLELAGDNAARLPDRLMALRLLADIRVWDEEPRLRHLLDDANLMVAIHAALALAAIDNHHGADLLELAMFDDDPCVRADAALALGRLKRREAVPGLIEALGQTDMATREAALRYLGKLGDPEAVDVLITALAEGKTRYLAVLALGEIGDARAVPPLLDMLKDEKSVDVRGYIAVALGWLEATETLPLMMQMLVQEPEIKWTPETLIRLGALTDGTVLGFDATAQTAKGATGLVNCREKPRVLSNEYMDRTTCESSGPTATVRFNAPRPITAGTLIVRMRHLLKDAAATPTVTVLLNGATVATFDIAAEFAEYRVPLAELPGRAGTQVVEISMAGRGRWQIDHLLIAPNTAAE